MKHINIEMSFHLLLTSKIATFVSSSSKALWASQIIPPNGLSSENVLNSKLIRLILVWRTVLIILFIIELLHLS